MTTFKCEHCGKTFKDKKTLDQHFQTEYVQKRWQCQVEGCLQKPISHRNRKKGVARHHRANHNDPPIPWDYRAVPPIVPDPQSVYYPEYMKLSEEARLDTSKPWYSKIGYYASDNEHPDLGHKLHKDPRARCEASKEEEADSYKDGRRCFRISCEARILES